MKVLSKLLWAVVTVLLVMSVFPPLAQAVCTPPPSNMVSWWGGDNNALDIVGTNHGTLMNGATFASGMVGQAFSFDGVDDYVDLGAGWFTYQSFTIDMWVKLGTTQVTWANIIDNNHTAYRSWELQQVENTTNQYVFSANSVYLIVAFSFLFQRINGHI